jgi:hypothetical protein
MEKKNTHTHTHTQSMLENTFVIATQFAIKVQLKCLTYRFCPWIYRKKLSFLCSHIKYMCQFGMNCKKFNLENKT